MKKHPNSSITGRLPQDPATRKPPSPASRIPGVTSAWGRAPSRLPGRNPLSPASPSRSPSVQRHLFHTSSAPLLRAGLCPWPLTSELGEAGLGCISQWRHACLPPPHLAAAQDLRTEQAGYTEKPVLGHMDGVGDPQSSAPPSRGGRGVGRWAKVTLGPQVNSHPCPFKAGLWQLNA